MFVLICNTIVTGLPILFPLHYVFSDDSVVIKIDTESKLLLFLYSI